MNRNLIANVVICMTYQNMVICMTYQNMIYLFYTYFNHEINEFVNEFATDFDCFFESILCKSYLNDNGYMYYCTILIANTNIIEKLI